MRSYPIVRSVNFSFMLLTADDLLFFQRCPRRVFLDFYGDPSRRAPTAGFIQKLHDESDRHKRDAAQQVAEKLELEPVRPQFRRGDREAGAAATLALMEAGAGLIVGGLLRVEEIPGVELVGHPDLLVKRPGQSAFGDWIYEPVDIRLGKKPKLEYQLVAALHADLLTMIQGAAPAKAGVILRGRSPHWVDLRTRLKQVQDLLANLIDQLMEDDREPELFISRNRCSLCHWVGDCTDRARQTKHLSLIPGVTPARYRVLERLKIQTIEQLAATPLDRLQAFPEFDGAAEAVLLQTRATLTQQPIALAVREAWSPDRLPVAPVELYFDIEAEPDISLDYLLGVLVVDRSQPEPTFHRFLAETPEDEQRIWGEFLALVDRYPTAPIFHFCEYERDASKRLAKLYGLSAQRLESLLDRFVDVHAWVTQTVVLPVEGYALKQIAGYLGFEWRDRTANGSQAVYWYDKWLKTGDRSYLEAIVTYNEDDCLATYRVKHWLEQFHQQQLELRSELVKAG